MHTCSTWSEDMRVVLDQLFPLFWLSFFPGPFSIGIDTLWAQLLLEFFTNHFETMHICSTCSEDCGFWVTLLPYEFESHNPLLTKP